MYTIKVEAISSMNFENHEYSSNLIIKSKILKIHIHVLPCAIKGRFLEFRMYHNFANLFLKLSESTFYKEISKFQ